MADELDPDRLGPPLRAAIEAQARSVIDLTVTAATMTGIGEQTVAARLESFAAEALAALAQLAAKAQALGVLPDRLSLADVPLAGSAPRRLRRLADDQQAVVDALHAVIPFTGQEPRSEAVEHLLEHALYRHQEQVDFLRRALGASSPAGQ